jgi:uncharacterized protein
MTHVQSVTIPVEGRKVSALLQAPPKARICYVLAHGAGGGMLHPFMTAIADGLAERDVATLRYQFPYLEQGSKRPERTLPGFTCWGRRVS